MKRYETFGDKQKEAAKRTCHICHGMGHIERGNGDVIDCPNRSCENGYITIKKDN